jgi:hypothetical protein
LKNSINYIIFAIIVLVFYNCEYTHVECVNISPDIPNNPETLERDRMELNIDGEKIKIFGACFHLGSQNDSFGISTARSWFYYNPDYAFKVNMIPKDTGIFYLKSIPNSWSFFYLTQHGDIIAYYDLDTLYKNSVRIDTLDLIDNKIIGGVDLKYKIKMPKPEPWMKDSVQIKSSKFNFRFL